MSTGTEQSHFPKGSRLGPCEIASSIGAGGDVRGLEERVRLAQTREAKLLGRTVHGQQQLTSNLEKRW